MVFRMDLWLATLLLAVLELVVLDSWFWEEHGTPPRFALFSSKAEVSYAHLLQSSRETRGIRCVHNGDYLILLRQQGVNSTKRMGNLRLCGVYCAHMISAQFAKKR